MSDNQQRLDDLLQLNLDGRLSPQERREIEEVLQTDRDARARLAALRWSKQAAALHLRDTDVPAALADRLSEQLRKERESAAGPAIPGAGHRWLSVPLAGLAAGFILLIGLLAWWQFRAAEPIPEIVVRDFEAFQEGRIELDIESADTDRIEAMFRSSGVRFRTRVFDFGMMGYNALGGRVHKIQDRTSAFFVYENAQGVRIICQMYRGVVEELPDSGRTGIRTNDGIEFHVYQTPEGITLVFWQEGDVTCVLASEGDSEETVQLAFAKAVKI